MRSINSDHLHNDPSAGAYQQTDNQAVVNKTPTNRIGWILEEPGVEEKIDRHARQLHRKQSIQDSVPPDLDDVKQSMRLKLIKREHKYDPTRGDPGGFVYTVLQNYIRTKQRFRSRKCRKAQFSARHFDELRDSSHASPADPVAEQVETQDLIEHCKDRLTDQQLRLLMLLIEKSERKAAAELGISRRQLRNMTDEIQSICSFIEESGEKPDHPIQSGIGHS